MTEDDDLDIPVDVWTADAATPVPLAVALLKGRTASPAQEDPRLAFLEGLLRQVRECRRARA